MARRRKSPAGDSLELLLDTICNVFGGIVLMAIMVVLHTQSAAGRVRRLDPQDVERRLETRRLRFQCGRLDQEIEQLRRRNRALEASYRAKATPTADKLMGRREEFHKAIDKADAELDQIRTKQARTAELRGEAEKELIRVNRELAKGRGEAERLKRQIPRPVKRIKKTVRLPRWHRPSAYRQVSFVVKGTKVYRLSEDCTATSVGFRGVRYTPRDSAGFQMPRKAGVPTGFLRALAHCSPRVDYISFWVCGTSRSFVSFQELRASVVEQGYEYSVTAYDPAKGLTLVPVPSGPPVE